MKNKYFRRKTALALSLLMLFAAAPLPQACAAPDEEGDTSSYDDPYAAQDDTSSDTGSEGGDSSQTTRTITAGTTFGNVADPQIDATAALLVNADNNLVLFEKNADEKRYPASTTKIMTALLTLQNVTDLNETVTAEDADFENVTSDSSNAGIQIGEQVRVIDLLYALMLPSANEAAYMLARHVAGSSEAFVDLMNAKASELGCTGTHFAAACMTTTTIPPHATC